MRNKESEERFEKYAAKIRNILNSIDENMQGPITTSFEQALEALMKLGDAVKAGGIGVRSLSRGTEEDRVAKTGEYFECIEEMMDLTVSGVKEVVMAHSISDVSSNLRELMSKSLEYEAKGIDKIKALSMAIADSKIPEEQKQGLLDTIAKVGKLVDEKMRSGSSKKRRDFDYEFVNFMRPKTSIFDSLGDVLDTSADTLEHRLGSDLSDAFMSYCEDHDAVALGNKMNVLCRSVFNKDKTHGPMFFASAKKDKNGVDRDGILIIDGQEGMVDNATKMDMASFVGRIVKKHASDVVIMVSECWLAKVDDPVELEEWKKSGKSPTVDHRKEALVVTVHAKDGATVMIINDIVRENDEVRLEPGEVIVKNGTDDKLGGRFTDYWKD